MRVKSKPRAYSEIKAARAALASVSGKQRRSVQISGNRIVQPQAKEAIRKVMYGASEKKETQTYLSQTDLVSNGVLLLNGVAEGDSEITRDGKMITSQKLVCNVMVTARPTTTIVNKGFWAIILDRQPNGADPTVTGVYDTTTVTDVVVAPRNNANLDRYKVLKREDFALSIYTGGNPIQSWETFIDLQKVLQDEKDKIVRYSGTGATIASLRTNSIYLIYGVSGQSGFADGTNYARISAGFKYSFTDN